MPATTCQYASCLEPVGAQGIVVSLKTETPDGEKRAIFCCAAHASLALRRLAHARLEPYDETEVDITQFWKVT